MKKLVGRQSKRSSDKVSDLIELALQRYKYMNAADDAK